MKVSTAPSPTTTVDGSEAPAATAGFWTLTVGSIGIVYGDIGTSPIYAFREAMLAGAEGRGGVDAFNVLGVLSLIFWSLIIVVTLKYVLILTRADNRGEGGTFALMALAQESFKRAAPFIVVLGVTAAALFYGNAIITPALSVLSAVEGLEVVEPVLQSSVLPLTFVILIALFAVQSRGTHRVAAFFGPVSAVWFLVLAVAGIVPIVRDPVVLLALNPTYAVCVPVHPRHHQPGDAGRRLPRRHRRRGALCRPRPFRPQAHPGRLARPRASRPGHQLFRPGRAGAGHADGARQSVLPALSGLGAAAGGGPRHRRHGHRQPGGDHRHLSR